ncbi:futalosine hydrolase [Mucilaginibacter sp. Bleaf8]|uniref:futalosine hydrolase n=1 Tax=Mucilaginibacter sp. Bleaf8 TaxID=2834430 RepID=UPI001BCC16DD|nr:futalosine hydrolase [Mucilaginibacter sp. Bleaf8]MBS7566592.1 futalosine hydrolase [Mucilaginibacter sp. Bleaf8]
MNILVVAATRSEIEPLLNVVDCELSVAGNHQSNSLTTHNTQLTTLVTGVGMVATAYALGVHLATHSYDLALNLGIAGSFDRHIALGDVVEVTEDTFGELGAEDDELFLPIETLGFGESKYHASAALNDFYADSDIKQVSGITVNTVHGNAYNIEKLTSRLPVQVESMEGAAFFYACKQAGVPALQIRAVSNYVEKRNRDAWKIGPAIKNLNSFAENLLSVVGCKL